MATSKKNKTTAVAGKVPDPPIHDGVKAGSSPAPQPKLSPEKQAMMERLAKHLEIENEISSCYGNVLMTREQPVLLICILKELVRARLWRESHEH